MLGNVSVKQKEECKAELQDKIKYHEKRIEDLKAKIANLDAPKKQNRSKGIKRILTEAKLSDAETAAALGFKSVDEMKEKLLQAAAKKGE